MFEVQGAGKRQCKGVSRSPSATPRETAAAAFTLVLNDLNVGGWRQVVGELTDGRLPGEVMKVCFWSVARGAIK